MSRERTSGSWTEPTCRRVVGSTVVLFLVILAFLVGRLRAGADPGLARDASQTTQQTAPPAAGSSGAAPQADPTDPDDPFAQPQADPNAAPDDNFGNAVPDQGGSAQGFDPPSTHVS
jgi:hypothetical protein